jgi:hypothetical protein
MTTIMKTFGVVFGIAIIIAIAVFMPLLYIWSLNTLFGLTIAYNIETWAAIVLLQMFFHTTISFKGK